QRMYGGLVRARAVSDIRIRTEPPRTRTALHKLGAQLPQVGSGRIARGDCAGPTSRAMLEVLGIHHGSRRTLLRRIALEIGNHGAASSGCVELNSQQRPLHLNGVVVREFVRAG